MGGDGWGRRGHSPSAHLLRVSGALRRGHGGPQATVEEEWDIEPIEEEESDFELEDLEEEHLLRRGRRRRH